MSSTFSPRAGQSQQPSVPPHHALRPEAGCGGETELVVIRGLPGSGKTTMAGVLALVGYAHFEADMFFMREGRYAYDSTRVRDAHAWCQSMTRKALGEGRRTVVSNTFTRVSEIHPYLEMSSNVRIIEAVGR